MRNRRVFIGDKATSRTSWKARQRPEQIGLLLTGEAFFMERHMHKSSILKNYTGGITNWRIAVVHYAAKAAGLMVKVEGFPLGSDRNITKTDTEAECCGQMDSQG